ncbi:MAG: penicillin-binding protein 2 [Chloroflexota bacterium]
MLKRTALHLCFCLFLLACADNPLILEPTPTAAPTPTPTEPATPTPLPSPEQSARNFLGAWEKGQYEAMYALLSDASKQSFSQEAFVKRYRDIATEGAFTTLKTQAKEIDQALNKAAVNFSVTISSTLAGTFVRSNQMPMTYEAGSWRVDWKPTVIFAELTPGNFVNMIVYGNDRADIYDRTNQKLAANEPLVTIGIVPRDIENENALLATLAAILEMDAKSIKDKYASARPEWYVPIKSITLERAKKFDSELKALKAVSLRDTSRRVYPLGTIAEHLVGYVGPITADELLKLAPQGYSIDDSVGKAGVEKWGEKFLRGELGGTLVVLTPDGQIVTTLSAQGPQPGRNIYTTLDLPMQTFIENELNGKIGAAVVLDVRTGEILAMASSPGYDLNTLTQGSSAQIQALLNDKNRPLVSRATQGLYPTGSVFKIVTASAGLEKGGFNPNSQFHCSGVWTDLGPQYAKTDWLKTGHGNISLYNGLIQSCDIVFYTVGLALDKTDRSILPTFARAFGYGAPTRGAGLVDEAGGNVPDPTKETIFVGDMVNVAIGQGDFLATPLQVANMLAAVANGGTLYRPRLIAKVSGPKDERRQDFQSEVIGKLPVSANNLNVIRAALKAVTTTTFGTAARAFAGFPIAVAGKTGTAESPPGEPHAWFAAYAPADAPRVAVVVLVEHGGEGSSVAAPIARRIFEKYFALGR